jgi:phosphatidyl-myo-inositol alpha-mannosyltransferase
MRIAQITEFYYPHLGGVTEHVHNISLQFIARGHDVTVLTSNMNGQSGDLDFVRRVGRSQVVYSNGSFARITTGWNLGRRIRDILREGRIELVHLHCPLVPTLGLVTQSVADQLDIPVVATFHSWFDRALGYRVFNRPLQRRLDNMRAKIAVSQPTITATARYFQADWVVIPNGVKVGYFHPNGRKPTDVFHRPPRLLFLGRLDPRNGLDTVLAAMPRILEHHPSAQLLIAGDGPLLPYYRWRARSLGDNVRFLGRVFDDRVDLYGTSDLYLCPTTKASFGITLLESMACGTPIVGSDVTGFRELIDGGGEAVLVPVNDPGAWADTVVALISDHKRREAMQEAGLAKAAQFDWPHVADRVLGIYRKVLA